MQNNPTEILEESVELKSELLNRTVKVDFYLPTNISDPSGMSLLLINDGQDMEKLLLSSILEDLYALNIIEPLLCVGIQAGERKMEYGTAKILDYKKRGARSQAYTDFIFEELLPFTHKNYNVPKFKEMAFAGFSLGGLSALDIVWNHPQAFTKVGVFSGSLWWRIKDKNNKSYNDDHDRIMQHQIRNGNYYPWLKFFFECGAADEEEDRNNNGIIDSIDDTLDLIRELMNKGYTENDIQYLQIEDGKHDVDTWARAMPEFLKWGWARGKK
ncbi:MAG TPA: alpha/beta hydrolase-fold protein [Puia sp.]|nr:alpha/beta hydrolase-fold protein [Puia sp.]